MRDAAKRHRQNLEDLDNLLEQIDNNPQPVGKDFEFKLRQLQTKVTNTLAEAQITARPTAQGTLQDRLRDLYAKLQDVTDLVLNSDQQIEEAKIQGREADLKAKNAKDVINRARESIKVRY